MRLPCTLLLAAVVVLANCEGASTTVESLMTTPDFKVLRSPMDNGQNTKRFLRIHKSTKIVATEERAISAPNIEMLQGWLKKGLLSDEVVGLLSIGNKADDLLTGSLLNAWVSYVNVFNKENPAQKMSMIPTLTARFGDEALATMIESAKKLPKTEALGKQMQAEQIQHWMSAGKSPDEVFALLKLNKAKSLLFDMPQVNSWVTYMDDFSSSGAKVSMITTLRKFYTDEDLAKMIVIASKNSRTADAAKRVEKELLRTWFNSMKTPTDILRLLQLSRLQASKSFLYPVWAKYIDLFNKVDPRFKKEMLQGWLKNGLITEDTFRLLTLGNAADDLLNGSLLSAWVNYVTLFNKENPAEKVSLIATLTARFGDEAVATMIEAAKKLKKTSAIAKQVQAEQLQHWMGAGKLPDDVFVLLKLNTAKTSLFDQPQLNSWVAYVDAFNKANLNSKTTLYSALATRYNDATLAQMLVMARNVPSSESIAMRIQAEQMRFWISTNKQPADVFKMLMLNKFGTSFLKNPIFNAWVAYTDDFRKVYPATHLRVTATLRTYYTDDVLISVFMKASQNTKTASMANRLEKELMHEWYLTSSPADVLKLLKLDQLQNAKVFESPLYTVWTKYIDQINKANPASTLDEVGPLTIVFGEEKLSTMLIAAERTKSTKEIATKLLNEQFKLWLAAKKHPEKVYILWQAHRAAANSPIKKLFDAYALAYMKL